MLGTFLAFRGNGSELSLWFLGLGWVLELTLIGLAWLGSQRLQAWSKLTTSPRVLHALALVVFPLLLALVVFPLLLAHRLLGRTREFKVLLAASSCFWLVAFLVLVFVSYQKRSVHHG